MRLLLLYIEYRLIGLRVNGIVVDSTIVGLDTQVFEE